MVIVNLVKKSAQQSVHPTCGILRHFQAFFWLRVYTALRANPHSAHTRVTQAVRRLPSKDAQKLKLKIHSCLLTLTEMLY
jgi:hypothetical protein